MIRYTYRFLEVKEGMKMAEEIGTIIKTYRETGSIKATARKLGISKNTVKRYLKRYKEVENGERERICPQNEKPIKVSIPEKPYEKKAMELLVENQEEWRKQHYKATTLHRQLRKAGYSVSYSSVLRVFNRFKEEHRPREIFIKQDHQPGQSVQFDWGDVYLYIGGVKRKLDMGVFTFPNSNHRFARVYARQSLLEVMDIHRQLFEWLQGVPGQIVYDNAKTIMDKVKEKRINPQMEDFSAYYGFDIRVCNPYQPQEKGSTEQSVGYVRREVFSNRTCFEDLEEVNQYLAVELMELNNQKVHEREKVPNQGLEEEKAHFLPLPSMAWNPYRIETRVINRYSLISVDSNAYSVPETYCPKTIKIQIYVDRIDLLKEDQVIGTHTRRLGKGETSLQIVHYLKTLQKKPGALAQSAALRTQVDSLQLLFDQYYTKKPKEFCQILELLHRYEQKELCKAIETVQKQGLEPTRDLLENLLAHNPQPQAPSLDHYAMDLPEQPPNMEAYDTLLKQAVS